jgi:hypothetical protein
MGRWGEITGEAPGKPGSGGSLTLTGGARRFREAT